MIPLFDKTIIVRNLLKAKDSSNREEKWFETKIANCAFTEVVTKTVVGTEVAISQNVTCRIPQMENYKPYDEWKVNQKGFTLSVGDEVVKDGKTYEVRAVKSNGDIFPHHRLELI